MTTEITLTVEQARVKTDVIDYFIKALVELKSKTRHDYPAQYKTLGGLAGTGKTTLVRHIVSDLESQDITCVLVTFTGKASDVLRRKGLNASTIHSTIYEPIFEKGLVVGFDKLTRSQICEDKHWVFIVDEGSMVPKEQFDDLLLIGVPILFVGDHGQLEPVGDDPKIMSRRDFVLTEIQRQAKENPIISFAYEVRETLRVPKARRTPPHLSVLPHSNMTDQDFLWADQIITPYNKQRHSYNAHVRSLKDLPLHPVPGDKLICLKNNRDLMVFNGQQFTVIDIHDSNNEMTLQFQTSRGFQQRRIPCCLKFLGQQIPPQERLPRDQAVMDFGYCITAHKSQGSEYDKVMVIEHWMNLDWMDPQRWRYTAATRAAQELRYFVPNMKF